MMRFKASVERLLVIGVPGQHMLRLKSNKREFDVTLGAHAQSDLARCVGPHDTMTQRTTPIGFRVTGIGMADGEGKIELDRLTSIELP